MNELTEMEKMKKWLALYMAICASDQDQLGNHKLAEQLYSASRAYELAMRGE